MPAGCNSGSSQIRARLAEAVAAVGARNLVG